MLIKWTNKYLFSTIKSLKKTLSDQIMSYHLNKSNFFKKWVFYLW
jgi:mevalonate pyrophosphate decarboxylase